MKITREQNFVGWIKAEPGDKEKLQKLGVRGEMNYNQDMGCFEYCEITARIVPSLMFNHADFWSGAFTAVDALGRRLPKTSQLLWSWSKPSEPPLPEGHYSFEVNCNHWWDTVFLFVQFIKNLNQHELVGVSFRDLHTFYLEYNRHEGEVAKQVDAAA